MSVTCPDSIRPIKHHAVCTKFVRSPSKCTYTCTMKIELNSKNSSSYFPSNDIELEWELPYLGTKDSSLPNHHLPSALKAKSRHLYERFCCLSMFSQQQLTLIMQTMQHRWSKLPSHHTCQYCFTWEFLLQTQNHHPFPSPQLSSQNRKRCIPRSIGPLYILDITGCLFNEVVYFFPSMIRIQFLEQQ